MVLQRGATLFSAIALPFGLMMAVHGTMLDAQPVTGATAIEGAAAANFARDIEPIMKKYCVSCHGGVDASGKKVVEMGLDLTTYKGIMAGGTYGPVVEAGKPEDSLLIELIESGEMPGEGQKVAPADIQTLRAWIAAGAPER